MINTSEHKSEDTVKSGVVDYPIGFPFYFNPDRTPQLLVKIGDEELRYNHNFELSEDNGSVVLRPTEEESWTLEGPEDFSWMTKWDGKDLLIERVVPFTQDSDYQLGRISSEQIERDFDLSVMRDQMLLEKIAGRTDDVQGEIDALHSRIDFVQEEHLLDMAAVDEVMATKATKTELENAKTVLGEGIQGNADAIQKTRDDYIEADSEIHKILNSHTAELTTLRGNQASLGDQVSGIEEKIPESASGSNPLVTKQQLLDEEMDIRDDLNETAGELQTQITAQAAEIATKQNKLTAGSGITIEGDTISSTGGGDFLPLSGGTITGKLVIDVGESPTTVGARRALGFTGTVDGITIDHWFSYIPQSSSLDVNSVNFTNVGNISPHGDGEKNIGSVVRKFNIVHANMLSSDAGELVIIPAKSGTVALTEDVADAVANIDALPDQTGNAGKVLTTDGSTASWQEPQGGGNFLPLTGGTVSGELLLEDVGDRPTPLTLKNAEYNRTCHFGVNYVGQLTIAFDDNNFGGGNYVFSSDGTILSTGSGSTLGTVYYHWAYVYCDILNNGADLIVPTEGGTLARLEDIDKAVGDISTALTAILGE